MVERPEQIGQGFHPFLLHDRDAIFDTAFGRAVTAFGLTAASWPGLKRRAA